MDRRKMEIDLLGSASKEELLKFKISKKADVELSENFLKSNVKPIDASVVTEEELLRIKKRGEEEILQIQNELKEFKLNEERKMSYMPIDEADQEEEEEEYIPTRLEKIKSKITSPFVKGVDDFDNLPTREKLSKIGSVLLIFSVLVVATLGVFSAKKLAVMTSGNTTLHLKSRLAGFEATPSTSIETDTEEYTLRRVIIDGLYTVFMFDGSDHFSDTYYATLIDNEGSKYYVDKYAMSTFRENYKGNVLVMDPLNDGIRSFDLQLEDKNTGEKFSFKFNLSEFLEKESYVQEYNLNNNYNTGLNIDSFISAASASVVNYSLNSDGLPYTYKIINATDTSAGVYEQGTILPSKQDEIEIFEFPEHNLVLYQQIISTPENFNSNIEFRADNIFKSYDVNRTYTREQVSGGISINANQYSLNIEGLQKVGDTAVLVYHCIDNSYSEPLQDEEGQQENYTTTQTEDKKNYHIDEESISGAERIYTYLDVDIIIRDNNGNIIETISPTKSNISAQGSDIVFVDERLEKVVSNFEIKINSINIRDSSYTGKIDPLEYYYDPEENEEYKQYLYKIQEAFESRLAYKAARNPRDLIVNFSDDVINDKQLMSNYMPAYLVSPATYSANVITSTIKDTAIYAVVEENFAAHTQEGYVNNSIYHRVVYDIVSEQVVSDYIINES